MSAPCVVILAGLSLLASPVSHAPRSGIAIGESAEMFPISAQQADRILYDALTAEFAGTSPRRITGGSQGLEVTIRFAIQAYTISALRIPATGQRADGSLVEGYRFLVSSSGTIPKTLQARGERLLRNVEYEAGLLAAARPVVNPTGATTPRDLASGSALLILTLGFALGLTAAITAASVARIVSPRSLSQGETRPTQVDPAWWSKELLELTHDAVIVWEMDGAGILYWNQAAEQLYGFDREQAHGKVTHRLLQTQVAGSVFELESRLARYGIWVGQLSHRTRDGKVIVVEGRLALLSQRNGRWLVLEVNRDLTDEARAAETSSAMQDRMSRLRAPAPETSR
jgi:PAS domain S-box-containing protein